MTSFEAQSILERSDMQRLLRDQPEVIEEGLLILAEEYGDWEESGRRMDLLALDKEGRLVVVELKRRDQQSMMDLQAVRYAAMVANMTWDRVVAAHRDYIEKTPQPYDDADLHIRSHLKQEDVDVPMIKDTKNPRIVLVSADFSKELTHSVLWLNQVGLNITCVKLQPYESGDGLFLERSQVTPTPKAEEFQVRWRDMESEAKRRESSPVMSYRGENALDVFREAARDVSDANQREMLEKLCGTAKDLEAQGLASLLTNAGVANTVLHMDLPGSGKSMVYGYKKGEVGFLRLIGSSFESHSPTTKQRIEEIVGSLGKSRVLHDLSDDLRECLVAAYREANGAST